MDTIIKKAIARHKKNTSWLERNAVTIKEIVSLCIASLRQQGKIIFLGNGGSAADAQHLAAELIGRFKKNRNGLAGIALSTNSSTLTALANDYGFDTVFSRQIDALAHKNDVVIALSTSGNSKNIIEAVKSARSQNIKTAGLLGKNGGDLKGLVDVALIVPEEETASIQEMHILAGHIMCEIIEHELFKEN